MSESNFLTVGGQTSFDMPLTFRAQSAVINNLSNQWVELLDANDTFVPPYIVNMIVAVGGGTRFRASFASPTGIPQAATIAGQRVAVEVFETAIPPNAGQLFPVRAPSSEWRNPKTIIFNSGFVSVGGPTALTAAWSYTVPTGRRARLDAGQAMSEIKVSDGSAAGTLIESGLGVFPGGGTGSFMIDAAIVNGTVVGARADVAIGASREIQAGDVVQGLYDNLRGAGVTSWNFVTAQVTEGDA